MRTTIKKGLLSFFPWLPAWKYTYLGWTTDLSHLQYFVLFIGNNRSGTTLVKAFLDAHPQIIIGHEVGAGHLIKDGLGWRQVAGRILASSQNFSHNPVWTGNDFAVARRSGARKGPLLVIGDKKSALTTNLLTNKPEMLDKILAWSPKPVRFIHVVRHPLDTIGSSQLRWQNGLETNCRDYFEREKTVLQITQKVGTPNVLTILVEDLVERPKPVLQGMFNFLEVSVTESFIEDCIRILFQKPNRNYQKINWPPELLSEVERQTRQIEHLSAYLDEAGRLKF